MDTKKYLYAAVGAQVAVAKTVQTKIEELVSKVNENANSASSELRSRIDAWAGEGEQFLGRMSDTKTLDDLTSKVDFDQVQTQVNKLRDQLEDIVATWRSNFRPETTPKATAEKVTIETTPPAPAEAPAAKATAARKPAARKPATKKPKATAPAAKKPAARKPAAKKPAAGEPVAGTTPEKPATKAS